MEADNQAMKLRLLHKTKFAVVRGGAKWLRGDSLVGVIEQRVA